jgi:hypothetical protein
MAQNVPLKVEWVAKKFSEFMKPAEASLFIKSRYSIPIHTASYKK